MEARLHRRAASSLLSDGRCVLGAAARCETSKHYHVQSRQHQTLRTTERWLVEAATGVSSGMP